jgi:6-pyruvoyltetrahydropterin/6-carboxytetrahydropterin synthase
MLISVTAAYIINLMSKYVSTKLIDLGSCAFRQHGATHSHCHRTHGYQLKAKFYFGCSELDSNNWSVDFGGLKDLKAILNKQFDHTLCIAKNDPLLPLFQQLHDAGGCDLRIMDAVGIEKTAEWCFKTAQTYLKEKYGNRCWVEKVEVYEHEANSAIYSEQKPVAYSVSIASTIPTPAPTESEQTNVEQLNIPLEPPATEPTPTEPPKNGPVPLRPNVTNGYSGLFDNLRWGTSR